MMSREELFEASVLQVVAPPPSLEFPDGYHGEQATEWIARLRRPAADRRFAFFDEHLDFLLVVHLPHPDADSDGNSEAQPLEPSPPPVLLSFLSHLQVSYETSYISPAATAPDPPHAARLSMPPPRTSSMHRNRPGPLLPGNPSIFPPHTPHPIPAASDADQIYVQSQGTPLVSAIWGDSDASDSDRFALLWDASNRSWLAIYKTSILVLFMITNVPNPLLCITVSTTLRNKPLPFTPPRQSLAAILDAAATLKSPSDRLASPTDASRAPDQSSAEHDEDIVLTGLEEVNLLQGLSAGPTFAASDPLFLPSSRLGVRTRTHEFALPPLPSASAATPVPYATGTTSPPPSGSLPRAATLRKSFRKTLKTLSGFRVRMRTVFVPYFLLPQHIAGPPIRKRLESPRLSSTDDSDQDSDEDILQEQEQREAGNEEHTVVLSVEIENVFAEPHASSASPTYHFEVERVDVTVGGTGARTALVGWASTGDLFPLRIRPKEQVNLLYAVSFLRGPEVDEFSLARPPGLDAQSASDELRRAVSINISGRPLEEISGTPLYPTRVYQSKWNCVLDLSSSSQSDRKRLSGELQEDEDPERFVLPTPASPFPTAPSHPTRSLTPTSTRNVVPFTAVAGSKRHTIAAVDGPVSEYARMPKSPMNYQSSTAMLNPANQPPAPPNSSPTPTGLGTGQTLNVPSHRASYIPPSIALQTSFNPRSPTTYNAPTSPPLPHPPSTLNPLANYTHSQTDSASTINEVLDPATPRTPAYPAYPSSPAPVPPTPFWQTPIAQQSGAGTVGPSVEIRRDRGGSLPQTPGPTVGGFGGIPPPMLQSLPSDKRSSQPGGGTGEPIIVSVGLLSPHPGPGPTQKRAHPGRLYPLDQFTLDIFVFNQSSWTRRFEVRFPEERRRRRGAQKGTGAGCAQAPGVIPLENRVRIGPLLPSTCQSVRMDFLALAPGVHSIDTLTLTDVQTGFTMNLRSVIDVIVHEPEGARGAEA